MPPPLLHVRGAINGGGYALGAPLIDNDSEGTFFSAEHVEIPDGCFIRLFPEIGAGSDAALHIESGARLALPLHHQGVVRVLDFSVTGQQPVFVAMEPFGGRSLEDVMAEDGIFPLPDAIAVLDDIADALQAAHTLGIVHGDLHPAAIRLSEIGAGRFATKVLGFGWAKEFRATSGERRHAIYLAPEQQQVKDGIPLSESADQFSLAAIAFEMLAGCSYLSEESSDLADPEARRMRQPPRVAEMVLGLPAGLDEVLRKALSFSPSDRFGDVGEFAAALRRLVEASEPARARHSSSYQNEPDADGTDLESLEAAATAFDDRRRLATLDPLTLPPLVYAATFPTVGATGLLSGGPLPGKTKPSPRIQILFWTAGAAIVILAVTLMTSTMRRPEATAVVPAANGSEGAALLKKGASDENEPKAGAAPGAPVGDGEKKALPEVSAAQAMAAPTREPAVSPKIRSERRRRHHAHARRAGSHQASGRRAQTE